MIAAIAVARNPAVEREVGHIAGLARSALAVGKSTKDQAPALGDAA